MCGCGGASSPRVAGREWGGFELTLPDGTTMPLFLTEAEAMAERRRRGGGTIRPVPAGS